MVEENSAVLLDIIIVLSYTHLQKSERYEIDLAKANEQVTSMSVC